MGGRCVGAVLQAAGEALQQEGVTRARSATGCPRHAPHPPPPAEPAPRARSQPPRRVALGSASASACAASLWGARSAAVRRSSLALYIQPGARRLPRTHRPRSNSRSCTGRCTSARASSAAQGPGDDRARGPRARHGPARRAAVCRDRAAERRQPLIHEPLATRPPAEAVAVECRPLRARRRTGEKAPPADAGAPGARPRSSGSSTDSSPSSADGSAAVHRGRARRALRRTGSTGAWTSRRGSPEDPEAWDRPRPWPTRRSRATCVRPATTAAADDASSRKRTPATRTALSRRHQL